MAKSNSTTTVNTQITDAVTQSNVKVLGEAPAMAIGNVYQSAAHSIGILYENAVNSQNQADIAYNATITLCVQSLKSN